MIPKYAKLAKRADELERLVSTQQPFTYKDECVEIGPHVAYDAVATAAAKAAIKEILNTVFAPQLVRN